METMTNTQAAPVGNLYCLDGWCWALTAEPGYPGAWRVRRQIDGRNGGLLYAHRWLDGGVSRPGWAAVPDPAPAQIYPTVEAAIRALWAATPGLAPPEWRAAA